MRNLEFRLPISPKVKVDLAVCNNSNFNNLSSPDLFSIHWTHEHTERNLDYCTISSICISEKSVPVLTCCTDTTTRSWTNHWDLCDLSIHIGHCIHIIRNISQNGTQVFTIHPSVVNAVFCCSAGVSLAILAMLFGIQRQNTLRHAKSTPDLTMILPRGADAV